MKNCLYVFTRSFPFSDDEPFLTNQLDYLSKQYERIYILPLLFVKNSSICLPENCFAFDPVIKSKLSFFLKGVFSFRIFFIYFNDFIKNIKFFRIYQIKLFLVSYLFTNNIIKSKRVTQILAQSNSNDIFFFFWGKGFANLIPFITHLKSKKVVQFHGDDLYHYRHGGYIPIQDIIIKYSDAVTCISEDGKVYLENYYPQFRNNIFVNYLGTVDHGLSCRSNDGIYRILSCSSVIPLKRVHLIFEAIRLISTIKIEWTHIGDGEDFDKLYDLVKSKGSINKVTLVGSLTNIDVIKFYKNSYVDLFINVSEFEGLPVSIMEAISFNVPVIATNVGGTREIVNSSTGILLNSNPTVDEIADSICQMHKLKLTPRIFWDEKFNAKNNSEKLCSSVLS